MNFIRRVIRALHDLVLSIVSYNSFKRFVRNHNSNNLCICVSHALSRSGAPQVLFETAHILKEHGYSICILSEKTGVLLNETNDIDIFVSRFLKRKYMKRVLECNPKICIVNTILLYEWAVYFDSHGINTLWWIHEGDSYMKKVNGKINFPLSKFTKVYCVSEWSQISLKKYFPESNSQILYYGISADERSSNVIMNSNDNQYFRITIIGSISIRKNQLELITAFSELPESISKRCSLTIVGAKNPKENDYYSSVMSAIEGNNAINYIPFIRHENIKEIYENSDLIVCTSVDDPLPVVITESMLFRKAFLTSNCTGQAYMVVEGLNGFTYTSGNTKDLTEKIIRIYEKKDSLKEIGMNGHKLFLKYFSKESFSNKLLSIVEHNNNVGESK